MRPLLAENSELYIKHRGIRKWFDSFDGQQAIISFSNIDFCEQTNCSA